MITAAAVSATAQAVSVVSAAVATGNLNTIIAAAVPTLVMLLHMLQSWYQAQEAKKAAVPPTPAVTAAPGVPTPTAPH